MVNKTGLDIYLVGGAVRDSIMNREPNDHDYVVVDSSIEEMKDRGFNRVGADFPVFLDDNGDEYALARVERKSGKGYDGFDVEWSDVELEADLQRRDFTINAIAQDIDTGEIIDPFGGRKDLEQNILRHVSDAFREDPLRSLRLARFASRFNEAFMVDTETMDMAQEIAPELKYVPGERIGEEIIKGFKQTNFVTYYVDILMNVDVFKHSASMIHNLQHVPAGYNEYHLEGDAFTHTKMVLDEIESIRPNDVKAYLSALVHDIGKYVTHYGKDKTNHGGHDKYGIGLVEKLVEQWKLSNEYKDVMKDACRYHLRIMNLPEMKAGKTIKFVQKLDRDTGIEVERLMDLVEADKRGREPSQSFDRSEIKMHLDKARKAIDNWDGQRLKDEGYEGTGEAFGQTLLNRRAHEYKRLLGSD